MTRFHLTVLMLMMVSLSAFAQKTQLKLDKKPTKSGNRSLNDQSEGNDKVTGKLDVKTDASQYKIISIDKDTVIVDTTLTIQKHYKFNYLRKDYLELLPFSNTGQVFNQLGYDFTEKKNTFSLFAARAKHIDYAEVEDIKYYEVATPFTELFFKTTMEQGQLAEGFFTVNTTSRFNVSIGYKGLRSIGKYRHVKTNGGRLRASTNYRTKNDRYFVRAHIAMQSIENQENGGIVADQIPEFENENTEFDDRSRFDVNFQDALNRLSAKRFYVNHYYDVFKKQDSTARYALSIGHVSNLEDKKYQFNQDTQNDYFGEAFTSAIKDEVRLERFYNQGYVSFFRKDVGALTANVAYTDYNYGYNSIVYLANNEFVPNRLKSGFLSYGLKYKNQLNKIFLEGNFNSNLSEDHKGSYIDGIVRYNFFKDVSLEGKIVVKASLPNFNYRLYQSAYKSYNWYNPNLELVKSQTIQGRLSSKKYKASVKLSYTTLQNHVYFGVDGVTNTVKPFQTNNTINYLKLTANKEFRYGKFALDNSIVFQNVEQSSEILNVPNLIARSSLYYTNVFFKKNLFLQTGITGNYFTEYNMNAYDPLLGEFYVQTQEEFGAFPRLDVFVNAKVRNARVYFKWEHVNSSFTGNNFYSAPAYPYKDRILRFGIVWNFFL